ncbi:unnamed protein product [Ilex paraguariensis]|uniref:Small auxin up regulated protein n=1 Tax=Ilex paraguariensis TaxID=185542 RepID=A0ABC8UR30_9AQUA
MENVKGSGKKNFILKTWERCRSINGSRRKSLAMSTDCLTKSQSWHCSGTQPSKDAKPKDKNQIAPVGCFTVYVGQERQRFVIKTQFANHPLFKMLLEDAELEYGYSSEGPILLPCEVDLFYKVLAEMDSKEIHHGRGFAYGSCTPFSPVNRLGKSDMAKGYGSYVPLTPSRLFKMNLF